MSGSSLLRYYAVRNSEYLRRILYKAASAVTRNDNIFTRLWQEAIKNILPDLFFSILFPFSENLSTCFVSSYTNEMP